MGCRRAAAWLLSVPLMLLGSQLAHLLAYRIVYPQTQLRLRALLATGHGYMVGFSSFLPLLVGVCGGIELVAFGWVVLGGVRRSARAPVPPSAFAFMPLVAFGLQEFLERWLAGADFPWQLVLEPTFRIGLLLQLPFAFVMYLLARLLLRVADQVAAAVRGARLRVRLVAERSFWHVCAISPLRGSVLAGGHAGRGPPFASSAALAVGRV